MGVIDALGRVALKLTPRITQTGSAIILSRGGQVVTRTAAAAGTKADLAGRFGYSLGKASQTIATGQWSAVGQYAAVDFATDMLFDVAEWAWDSVDDNDRDESTNPQKDIAFGTLDTGMRPTDIEDTFTVNYPEHLGEALRRPFDLSDEKTDGKRKTVGRLLGFWGVHIDVKSYDASKVSGWRYPLDRRNFGSIAFCRGDVPIQESPIHFGHQTILVPMVRVMAVGGLLGDCSQHVTNRVHGCLAPSVKATISFIPVYETFNWDWKKPKPT